MRTLFSLSMLAQAAVAAAADPANTNSTAVLAPRIKSQAAFVLACSQSNDLYRAMSASNYAVARFNTPAEAITKTPPGGALLILADGYPDKLTQVPTSLLDEASAKKIRMLIEYPADLDGTEVGQPRKTEWERVVVATDFFGEALPPLRILGVHDCHFVPMKAASPHLVAARVAGFDRAVFGLPKETWPILVEHPTRSNVLVASTKLSQFVTARYAPAEAWQTVWPKILSWLQPGGTIPELKWSAAVRPSYNRLDPLPSDAETQALRRGIEWYYTAKMFLHPQWQTIYDKDAFGWPDRTGPAPRSDWPCGDGSLGVLEGFSSRIAVDGSQSVRWWRRDDCNGEVAGTLALAGAALGEARYKTTAANLTDWLCARSIISQGNRADRKSPAYGLFGWNDVAKYWRDIDGFCVYYGDGNARAMLGAQTAAAVLGEDRWDSRLARCVMGNFRTTGSKGFRTDRIEEPKLVKLGWQHYRAAATVTYDMHYEAYLWSCFLLAAKQSGYHPLLERTRNAIGMSITTYPDHWPWMESMQIERARALLPLAWLVRADDTPEHRQWLKRIATDLLAHQDPSGALYEQLGAPGRGIFTPPRSNADYGTSEAPLIQSNEDRAADLLYSIEFAFLGLHEAAAATGDPFYRRAEDKLAAFLCRVQVRAPEHPELDGAWFRAVDLRRWDYWASSADAGWGAWSIETGWTQSWIVSVLALRRLNTSLWELNLRHSPGKALNKAAKEMIGDSER